MSLFILTFLSIYALMHSIVFWGIYPLIRGKRAAVIMILLVFAAMIFCPLLVRAMENAGNESIARVLAWLGFSWLGLVFLAFSVFLPLGLWELIVKAAASMLPRARRLSIRSRLSSLVVLGLVVAAGGYGFWEAANIKIETVVIETDKLLPQDEKITIAQVSDIHLGLMLAEGKLQKIVDILRQINPDIIVSTGDMVDAQIDHIDLISPIWQSITPPLGKYAVLGNHEFYGHLTYSIDFHENSGFILLRQQGLEIDGKLNIAGVDDPAGGFAQDEIQPLSRLDQDKFTILLKHRPTVNPQSVELFDLQLSGHSHKGQIFPFSLITALQYPMQSGLHKLNDDTFLYTNPGTGTWGPPMRIAAAPEITVFEIVPQNNNSATK